jgi:hypothetical protein
MIDNIGCNVWTLHILVVLCYELICRQSLSRQDIITAPSESRFQIDVEANWTESSKVTALLQNLEALRASGSSKSIVFSQWTAFLDLLEIPLKRFWPFSCLKDLSTINNCNKAEDGKLRLHSFAGKYVCKCRHPSITEIPSEP